MREIKNAAIEEAELTTSDFGSLVSCVRVNYGGSSQGVPSICLYTPKSSRHYKLETGGAHHIFRLMEIAGVTEWSRMKGRNIRVQIGDSGFIEAVGHIIKDDWYNPSIDFKDIK